MDDSNCSVCGGPKIDPASPLNEWSSAYHHADDCRVRNRREYNNGVKRMKELIEASSLGTPGAQALIKIGRLAMQGLTNEEIQTALSSEDVTHARDELNRLQRQMEQPRW
ncbi:MAG TPA: hypothetical protein VH084_28430 [Mycobacterium sp.]|jgi:hypothetical protein|nr:hypothetical protein [Mycobacterium sp.]